MPSQRKRWPRFYHFAFEAGNEAALEQKCEELRSKGIEVSDVIDHNWAKSIYFKDPKGISLEYCCLVREFNDNDACMQDRFKLPLKALDDPINALQSPDKHSA